MTDGGPDAKGQKLLCVKDTADHPRVWAIDSDCFCHYYHLEAESTYTRCDQCMKFLGSLFKYYAAMATLFNVLRTYFRKIYDCCLTKYGLKVTRLLFPRAPPKPLSGRWGARGWCEDYCPFSIVIAGMYGLAILIDVMTTCLSSNVKVAQKLFTADTRFDDPSLDASKEFSMRYGRWSKIAIDMLNETQVILHMWWR